MKNRNQQGFTLIEILLVLAIIAALGVAAFIIYPRVQAGRQATNNTSILNSAAAQINAVFPGGRYGKLTPAVACNADVFPDNFDTDGSCGGTPVLQNEWAGDVVLSGSLADGTNDTTSNARYYKITYDKVPNKVCNKLAPALASNFGRVLVGTTVIVDTFDAATNNDVVDEAAMTAACSGANEVLITVVGK